MTHVINPWLFYWIQLAEEAKHSAFRLSCAMEWFFAMFLICAFFSYVMAEKKIWQIFKNWHIALLVSVYLTACSLSLFLPTKDTLYKMVLADMVTIENIKATGEAADKLIDAVVEKINKVSAAANSVKHE